MATKSRLGKGLGALFPALPGDPNESKQHAAEPNHTAAVEAGASTSVKHDKASSRASQRERKLAQNRTPARDTASVETRPQHQRKHDDVSRETSADTDGRNEELKPVQGGYLAELRLDDIGPNKEQPRTIFDEDELRELAESIREVGVLQPIVVRKRPQAQLVESASHQSDTDDTNDVMRRPYELIMGERRWRASQLAGLETIPAIVKTTSDNEMLRDALLENLHRVALNPLEEAAAYQQMIDEFGLTQAQLSKSVSKSRPQIANTLRLLNLPASVQKKVAAGVLSAGHARALLGLSNEEDMDKLANRIIAEGLSVRSTEEIVALKTMTGEKPKKENKKVANPWADSPIRQHLEQRLDTKVTIKGNQKKGRIEITFSSPDDMQRILDILMPQQQENASAAADGESDWV